MNVLERAAGKGRKMTGKRRGQNLCVPQAVEPGCPKIASEECVAALYSKEVQKGSSESVDVGDTS